MNQPQYVYVQRQSKNSPAALALGIIGTVLGALALIGSWIPVLGLIAIPIALVGGLLAGIGFIISMASGGKSIATPLIGIALCVLSVVVAILATGGFAAALDEVEQRREELRSQQETADSASADAPGIRTDDE